MIRNWSWNDPPHDLKCSKSDPKSDPEMCLKKCCQNCSKMIPRNGPESGQEMILKVGSGNDQKLILKWSASWSKVIQKRSKIGPRNVSGKGCQICSKMVPRNGPGSGQEIIKKVGSENHQILILKWSASWSKVIQKRSQIGPRNVSEKVCQICPKMIPRNGHESGQEMIQKVGSENDQNLIRNWSPKRSGNRTRFRSENGPPKWSSKRSRK